MTVYAYCVRRAGDPPPEAAVRGIGGAEVYLRESGTIGVWLSELDATPEPAAEHLLAHDTVVRAALRSRTPLPLRFGAAFADEAAAFAALTAREGELREALARVDGRAEMAVTLLWDADRERERLLAERTDLRPPAGTPAGGRAYLEARRRAHALESALRDRAGALLDAVSGRLSAADSTALEARTVLPRPGVAGTLAHLVRREHLFTYRELAERAGEGLAGVMVRVSGPWAPYSFV